MQAESEGFAHQLFNSILMKKDSRNGMLYHDIKILPGNSKIQFVLRKGEITLPYIPYEFKLANIFSDVDYPSPYYQSIINLFQQGIMNGYRNGAYGINDTITRAQAAVMLVNMLKLPTQGLKANFSDVNANHFASAHIAAAVKAKILNGYGNGQFGPDHPITRAQLAVMIYNACKLESPSVLNPVFKDVPKGFWAFKQIMTMKQLGIINGYSADTFRPDAYATRAHFAKILDRAMQK